MLFIIKIPASYTDFPSRIKISLSKLAQLSTPFLRNITDDQSSIHEQRNNLASSIPLEWFEWSCNSAHDADLPIKSLHAFRFSYTSARTVYREMRLDFFPVTSSFLPWRWILQPRATRNIKCTFATHS